MFKRSLKISSWTSVVIVLLISPGTIQAIFGCFSRANSIARRKFLLNQAILAAEIEAPKWGQDPLHPLTRAQVDALIAARRIVPVASGARV